MTYCKKERRFITLIEMLIVMFLIGLITAVVAVNYRGTLDKGKAFKTEQSIQKIRSALELYIAENPEASDDVESRWLDYLRQSPLVSNPQDLEKDGWGNPFEVRVVNEDGQTEIQVNSERYNAYKTRN